MQEDELFMELADSCKRLLDRLSLENDCCVIEELPLSEGVTKWLKNIESLLIELDIIE